MKKVLSSFTRADHYLKQARQERRAVQDQDLALIKSSGFFDEGWYITKYPDVAKAEQDPMLHYLRNGGEEGRDPGPNFSSSWYLDTYYDVKTAGINPLVHYLRHGRQEGRDPNPPYLDWQIARQTHPWIPGSKEFSTGINLVGYLRTANGIGEAARNNLLALEAAKIPHSIIDYEYGIPAHELSGTIPDSKLEGGFRFNTNLFHTNAPELVHLAKTFNKSDLTARYNIGVWYWELPDFPEEWRLGFGLVDEIWVGSQFVLDCVSAKSPVPVVRIPPCIHLVHDARLQRSDFDLPADRFLFLCAYDANSTQARKNPQGVVEGFKRAFPRNDSGVGLIIKINNARRNPDEIKRLREELQGYSNCYFIEESLDRSRMSSLINLVDAYVSLHRSEGFGLIPAEAMSFGKPVIMTRWSGNLDFMTADNSCGVDYKLIPVNEQAGPYKPGQIWADPDIDHAAFLMQKLFNDENYRNQVSADARQTIHDNFSPRAIGRLITKRLQEIGLSI